MAIEKAKNVNLLLAPSLWKRLLAVAGPLGQSRAAFIRVVLEQAAYSKDPGAYMPRAAQAFSAVAGPSGPAAMAHPKPDVLPRKPVDVDDSWVCMKCYGMWPYSLATCAECGTLAPPRPPPAPLGPTGKPIPSEEQSRSGMEIESDEFDVPMHWVDWDGRARSEYVACAESELGISWRPPPERGPVGNA